jgi:hypothetical protein
MLQNTLKQQNQLTTKASSSLLDSIYKKRKLNGNEEIDKYIQIPQENTEIDPIEWWKTHESSFPCLSKFAFDILCIIEHRIHKIFNPNPIPIPSKVKI